MLDRFRQTKPAMTSLESEIVYTIEKYGHKVVLRHYDYSGRTSVPDEYKTTGYRYSDSVELIRMNSRHEGEMLDTRSAYMKSAVDLHRGDLIIEKYIEGRSSAITDAQVTDADTRAVYKIEDITRLRWTEGTFTYYKVLIEPHFTRNTDAY